MKQYVIPRRCSERGSAVLPPRAFRDTINTCVDARGRRRRKSLGFRWEHQLQGGYECGDKD